MDNLLRVKNIAKDFVHGKQAVHALVDVSFEVRPGEFVTVLGPSGCGKSTLLHMVGGFERATSGVIELGGQAISRPGRDRGMMFQQATLLPWWTIERNVSWALTTGGTPRRIARARTRELLKLVGLEGFEGSYPAELSGGMQQRAALARTLALEPTMLLMDEPFGALDALTREVMQEELSRIWSETGASVLLVTHDINEAIFLGDRVLVMSGRPGRIIADIEIALERPRNAEVKTSETVRDYYAKLWSLIREVSRGGSDVD